MRYFAFAGVFLFLSFTGIRSQQHINPLNDDDFTNAARMCIDSLVRTDEFSGVVLVARDNKPIFIEAHGYSDAEKKTLNNVHTGFNIGSIIKSFTRVAIYQLVDLGAISLDDPIIKFLPDYPNQEAAENVHISHLLNMTSGIGDFFGERYQNSPKEEIRAIRDYLPLFADKPLEFTPGSNRRYSNGGYIVLGAIIEVVSGMDYYTYVRENVFIPAGMINTNFYEKDRGHPNIARGYMGPAGRRVSNYETLPARGSSAGGGYSTVHDLWKYILALRDGVLKHPAVTGGGGMGIAGGAPGLNAIIEWDMQSGNCIIVLSNYSPPVAENLASLILKQLAVASPP